MMMMMMMMMMMIMILLILKNEAVLGPVYVELGDPR